MREAGLIVNDIPRIHTRQEDLTNQTHCIVSRVDGDENGTNLNIHMKLDGNLSYFPTHKLTMDELEECEYMETVYLSPDAAQWNPYDVEYAESEDKFLYFRGDIIHRQPKRWKILDDSDVFELQVSEENYEAAISSIVGANDTGAFKYDESVDSFSMKNDYFESKSDFVRDDDYMQAAVTDLTGCLYEELLRRAVNERTAKSNIAMESRNITLEGLNNDEDDSIFELSAAHADIPKGVAAEHLSKVWRI